MNYRRSKAKGGTYFFTVVTHNRKKILCDKENIRLIKHTFQWEYSTFHRYVKEGIYPMGWGVNNEIEFDSQTGNE